VVLATHPLLDTLTDGGLGCALFWPFDLTRYFAPWRPIQVAPIGLAFLSPYGAIVAMSEIVLFLPLFVFALRTSDFKLQTSAPLLLHGSPPRG
jgi:inner membrane protein